MQIRGCFGCALCGLYPVLHGHGRFCLISIETNNIKGVLIIFKLPMPNPNFCIEETLMNCKLWSRTSYSTKALILTFLYWCHGHGLRLQQMLRDLKIFAKSQKTQGRHVTMCNLGPARIRRRADVLRERSRSATLGFGAIVPRSRTPDFCMYCCESDSLTTQLWTHAVMCGYM